MKAPLKILLLMLTTSPSLVYPWEEGIDYDVPLSCSALALNGADKIVVRVKPVSGSYGFPKLVGLKDESVQWTQDFPNTDKLNVAKFEARCKGTTVTLWYQSPGVNVALVQEYMWDGKSLNKIRVYHQR